MEAARMVLAADEELIDWLRGLPYYYETPRQIFVHAGIDEESGDWWPWATPEYVFVGKYPAETGRFYKDIIAGHVGTSGLAGNPVYHDVWWDGQSHYYIDGSVQRSGRLNILAWDEEQGYRQWDGGWKGIYPACHSTPGRMPETRWPAAHGSGGALSLQFSSFLFTAVQILR